MSGITKDIDNRRRKLLLGGLAAGAAGVLQACGGGGSTDSTAEAGTASSVGQASEPSLAATRVEAATTVSTPGPIPANQVNLADHGGVTGGSPSAIIGAFNRAFSQLKALGGGTLVVNPGVYNLGSFSGGAAVSISDLQNVLISAYGAKLTITTTAVAKPTILQFTNPNNVTIAGMSFTDPGADINVQRGAICVDVQSTMPRSGFKMVDCASDHVTHFFNSQMSGSNQYKFTGFDIHGTCTNTYYAVNPNRNGRFSKCNITCGNNVRRAVVAHGARDWNFTVNVNRTTGLGSNAFIALVPFPDAPVQDVTVNLTATGNLSAYSALVNFYHQGVASSFAYARNTKVKLAINNATAPANTVVTFTAEPPGTGAIQSSTICSWEKIEITGNVAGSYNGAIVKNPTISSASSNSILVANKLAAYQNMSALPSYFKVFTPAGCSA